MIHLLWSGIVGFVIGLFATAVVPGADQMGLLATTGVGVVGSLIGRLLGRLIKGPAEGDQFHPAGFLMSIVGAALLLLLLRFLR